MNAVVSKVAHSIMTRLAIVLGAMGCMIGAAVFVSWVVFESIDEQMTTLSEERLPQMRAGADVTTATDRTREMLSNILIASDAAQLETLEQETTSLVSEFRNALEELPIAQRDTALALLNDADPALSALLEARQAELKATSTALLTLENAFDTANSVSGRLVEATDSALFDMTIGGEDAISSMDETLTNLVERDFAQFQAVLAIQSEVNLLSGLALTLQQRQPSATQSITEDLAISSMERLKTLLEQADSMPDLNNLVPAVSEAMQVYQKAFSGAGRPPSPNDVLELRLNVDAVLSPAVDDVYFNLIIGSDDAKATSETALTELMESEVATMRDMAALDAATKSFFSLALKTALARTPMELSLAQGELTTQEAIVRTLIDGISDESIRADVEQLLTLSQAKGGISEKRAAVFDAQVSAAQAASAASEAVSAIARETAAFSSAALNLIDETAAVLSWRVESAGLQISQIATASIVLIIAAPLFVWFFVTRPLNRVTSVTERLASGDLSQIEGLRKNNGELGRMATALYVFRENALQTIQMREDEREREKTAIEEERAAEIERIKVAEAQEKQQKEAEENSRKKAELERKTMIANLSASLGAVVSAASQGDFTKRVIATFDDEELSGLANSVNALVDNVDEGLSATGRVLAQVARGDLTEKMSGEFSGSFANLQNDTNEMIEALRQLVTEIVGSGANLASSSAELRDTSDGLSRQAEQNAASLEETSAALEELSSSIKQVNGSATDASENARVASLTAQSSGEVAAEAAASMSRIADASKEITQVVGVINDIAFQINLLALNAGVEAARAGEAGRGFSVVASEVRQLAQRASEAAKEIDIVISKSDEAVSEGVSKVGSAQSSLEKITESVVNISGRVEDISRAISEQVHGIGEITNAVSQIDQNTQKQAASFEEVTAASSLLATEADTLQKSTAQFDTGSNRQVSPSHEKPSPDDAISMKKISAIGAG